MSFCTKGLPGVAESTVFKKRSKTISLEGEGARRADEGKLGTNPKTLYSHGPPHSNHLAEKS